MFVIDSRVIINKQREKNPHILKSYNIQVQVVINKQHQNNFTNIVSLEYFRKFTIFPHITEAEPLTSARLELGGKTE